MASTRLISQKRWGRIWPLLVIVAVWLCMAAFGFYKLAWSSINFKEVPADTPVVRLESEHFIVESPRGYLTEAQLSHLLARAEEVRAELLAYLELPDKGRRIKLRLWGVRGISRAPGSNLIYLYYEREGRSALVHEMTHCLMGWSPSRLLTEGLAVYTQERFGSEPAFPQGYWSVNLATIAQLRRGLYVPLPKLTSVPKSISEYRRWNRPGPVRRQAYLEAGSFTKYLIGRYGLAKFKELYYNPDYEKIYGKSLSALEQEWLTSLRPLNLLISLAILAGGLTCLFIASQALIKRTGWWWVAAGLAPLAFAVLEFYLGHVHWYWLLSPEFGLVMILLVAALVSSKISLRWGQMLLWSLGAMVLGYYVLLPTLRMPRMGS